MRSSSSGRSYQPRVSHSCCCFSCCQRASISSSVVFTIPSFYMSHRIRVVDTTPGIEADCKYAFESSGTQWYSVVLHRNRQFDRTWSSHSDICLSNTKTTSPEIIASFYHISRVPPVLLRRDRPTPRALFRVLDETNGERERERYDCK